MCSEYGINRLERQNSVGPCDENIGEDINCIDCLWRLKCVDILLTARTSHYQIQYHFFLRSYSYPHLATKYSTISVDFKVTINMILLLVDRVLCFKNVFVFILNIWQTRRKRNPYTGECLFDLLVSPKT